MSEVSIPEDLKERLEAAISSVVEHDASDLYFRQGEVPRLKMNGQLWSAGDVEWSGEDLAVLWRHLGADPTNEGDRDFDCGFESPSKERFRVNLHRERGHLAAVLRRIKADIPKLEVIGAPMKLLTDWFSRPSGLILCAGPTGSGKSTTLAACLDWLNHHQSRHVVTIEDPIEYLFQNEMAYFTQRAVGLDTESFASGLRSALRQAPDVIFVGEIRDTLTAETALQASETGHVVVATVHSSTVPETIERITNLLPSEGREGVLKLLSKQLVGIVCQRLLPAIGEGRTLICETMENAGATRDWIEKTDLPQIAEFLTRKENPENIDFLSAIVSACEGGKISPETAEASCSSPVEFRRAYRGMA